MMYIYGNPEQKYEIIQATIARDNNLLNVQTLCQIAGVSRSGYYHWVGTRAYRDAKEARDKAAVPLRDILPLVGAQKQAVHKERVLVLRLAERSRTFRDVESRNDVHTPELISTAGQCLLDYHRHRGATLKEDPVS